MTKKQLAIHEEFARFRRRHVDDGFWFVRLLQKTERSKLHRAAGKSSVVQYVMEVHDFSAEEIYPHLNLARAAVSFPQLLTSGLSVARATRIVATLTAENCDELIEFARNNTFKNIDREVAKRNPRSGKEKFKRLAEDYFEMRIRTSAEFEKLLERVESLQAQRGRSAGRGLAIEEGLRAYIERWDPVARASRAEKRAATKAARTEVGQSKRDSNEDASADRGGVAVRDERNVSVDMAVDKISPEFCAHRISKRVPLTAAQKHAVFQRDGGCCQFRERDGRRCGSDRWVQVHHIVEVQFGGRNEPENLTTLCSVHHDWVHQMSFDLDGQVG